VELELFKFIYVSLENFLFSQFFTSTGDSMVFKYPEVMTVREFEDFIRKCEKIIDQICFVEPKYDGSNITVIDGTFYTRNLNPLSKHFQELLQKALGKDLKKLIELSKEYQVFFELGGYLNSPAGYKNCWSSDADYVIFDLVKGSQFVNPEKAKEIVEAYGLKFVDIKKMNVRDILENWQRMLNDYKVFEGFVIKIPTPSECIKITRHNYVLAKFKHEYLGEKTIVVKKEPKSISKKDFELPELEQSEVFGAINKAHLELGSDIFDKKKAMPKIFEYVRQEAEKHGRKVPSASKIYRYYLKYLERIKEKK